MLNEEKGNIKIQKNYLRHSFNILVMHCRMESDSDDSVIERVSSVKSTPESFDVVPDNRDYQLRFLGSGFSSRGTKLVFKLNKDKELPYVTKTITKKGRGKYLIGKLHILHLHH